MNTFYKYERPVMASFFLILCGTGFEPRIVSRSFLIIKMRGARKIILNKWIYNLPIKKNKSILEDNMNKIISFTDIKNNKDEIIRNEVIEAGREYREKLEEINALNNRDLIRKNAGLKGPSIEEIAMRSKEIKEKRDAYFAKIHKAVSPEDKARMQEEMNRIYCEGVAKKCKRNNK